MMREPEDDEPAQDRLAEQAAEDLRELLAQPAGRRTLWRLLGLSGVYRLSFSGDAAATAFNEGRRSVGLQLLADIEAAAPRAYAALRDENTQN